jgi:hypothetical protein
MKSILCCSLILLTALFVNGQPVRGVTAVFRVGYGHSQALTRMERTILPDMGDNLSKNYLLIGWESNFRLERAVIGIEGTAAIATENNGIMYSDPFMISAHYKAGYILFANDRRWLYPSIGTGPAFLSFSSYRRENGNYVDRKSYNLLSPSIDFGINGDYVFPRFSSERRNPDRFIVGFRGGYIWSFTKNHWRDDDWNQIPGTSAFRNNSYYLTIVVGQGGFIKVLQPGSDK